MNEIERRKTKQQEQQQQLQTNTQITNKTNKVSKWSINYVKCLNVKINEKMKDNFNIVTSTKKKTSNYIMSII